MCIFALEMIEIKDIHGKLLATIEADTLEFADLSEMDLEYADLKGANLDHANLYFTNLRFADLRDASLRYARTYGTQFGGTILEGAQRRVHHSMHSFL
jgi:uncharacterized protein YjbI with pentapeptide repeats